MRFSFDSTGSNSEYLSQNEDIIVKLNDKRFQYVEAKIHDRIFKNYAEIIDVYDNKSKLVMVYGKDPFYRFLDNSSDKENRKDEIINAKSIYLINAKNVGIQLFNNEVKILEKLDKPKRKLVRNFIVENNITFKDDLVGLATVSKYYNSL